VAGADLAEHILAGQPLDLAVVEVAATPLGFLRPARIDLLDVLCSRAFLLACGMVQALQELLSEFGPGRGRKRERFFSDPLQLRGHETSHP
jgi:hypothetical protein